VTKIYDLATKIFPLVVSWLPNEKVNFEPGKGYGFSAVLIVNRVLILADFSHFGHK